MKLNYSKLLVLIFSILVFAFIFVPYKQEIVCENYQCNIGNYYLHKCKTNTIDISNGLEVEYHSMRRAISYWELNPLNIIYFWDSNANKDMRNIVQGTGKITKYSIGIIIITFILSLIASVKISL